MKRLKNKGFALVLVIVIIALTGAEMFVLAGTSNTILFQTNNAYLKAAEQNLTASGLAWAQNYIENKTTKTFNKKTELNPADIGVKKAALSVTVEKPGNNTAKIQINARYCRGRQTLRHSEKYRFRL